MKPLEIETDAWCAWCGEALPEPEDRDPRQLYCSAACAKANWHDINKPMPIGKRRGTCAACGAEFWTHHPERQFCSRRCCVAAWKRRHDRPSRAGPPPPPRPCIECGKAFQPARKDRLYCSKACGNIHRNRRWREGGINRDALGG